MKTLTSEHPSISSLAKLNHEAEIVKKENFTGGTRFLGMVQHKNKPVLIIEDIGGISLSMLYQSKTMELEPFLNIAIQISAELEKIHQENVIHKDINPSNLILNPETNQVQIIDFGISSRLSKENLNPSSPERIEGTLAYISPEQTGRMNRSIDYRTDFYSLGVTFYVFLTGQRPFISEDPVELVHCHIAKTPLPLRQWKPEIPEMIQGIIMKLMSKTPERTDSSNRFY